ncbi:type II secretion system protein [Acidithiobacillus thiooxidans]|uniref:type IV pilus modification PilV family protein n=1 Tax=Acidithiobacillus thiooxidans TaxID=930 RepID=UPI001C07D50E|nr:prepilin-type N-terminal cleavage/methylation domain-containing protein [Acidithiobacillus thiooxidans]MBU2840239.1 type II secretion system protein [Acidithiobacillus thiooxidans]
MDHTPSASNESGFGLVEVLIAMLIFAIAATGVTYSLVQSDRQMIIAEQVLNGEQYGMTKSLGDQTSVPTLDASIAGQKQSISMPVTMTLSPVQPTQACSAGLINGLGQAIGNILKGLTCIFGGCQNQPATQQPTSYTVSVPVTAFTTSQSQIAWWLP